MPPADQQTTERVFLSYSRADQTVAIALRTALEQAGLSVFKDDDSLRTGDRWLERLQEALHGCSAFVVLVGREGVRRWVGAEVQVALIRHLAPAKDAERLPLFPILLEDARPETLPPFLVLFQATRWRAAEALPTTLLDAIRARAIRLDSPPAIEGCPFVGLNAFTSKDSRLFFGRRKETLEALACLGEQQPADPDRLRAGGAGFCRWLQIEGNSGAGKSSLVNAGLLPMIEQGALWARTGCERWRILGPMMPGRDPLEKLAEVVEHALIAAGERRDTRARAQRFAQDERARVLALDLRDAREEQTAFLLIVDQFEELFTFADPAARKQFDALLAGALQDPECPLFLISTVRADFLDRFEQLPRLQEIYNSLCKRYFLPTISEHGLREVIEQPARLAGLDVSEVSTAILADARDEIGSLPLVENALYTLWQQRQGNVLSGERYRESNGIAGMLSAQADALLARIDGEVAKGRQSALELLLWLTRINDEGRHTRQRIPRDQAARIAGDGKAAAGERVLRLLSGERRADVAAPTHAGSLRLITISTEQDQQYVDLIHETLIRAAAAHRPARCGRTPLRAVESLVRSDEARRPAGGVRQRGRRRMVGQPQQPAIRLRGAEAALVFHVGRGPGAAAGDGGHPAGKLHDGLSGGTRRRRRRDLRQERRRASGDPVPAVRSRQVRDHLPRVRLLRVGAATPGTGDRIPAGWRLGTCRSPGHQRQLARGQGLHAVAEPADGPGLPVADRGRVGVRRPRRDGHGVLVGEGLRAGQGQLHGEQDDAGAGSSSEPLGTARHRRQCL
ncbi:MAG: putative protein containing caspase domain protein [Candidatus Accumulibacter phosphatis]|uniref:TIR domain-containing protein n=1 Tax=Candidatus Accumulibacter phosphatis TaxID=327160 RepID=A0A080LZT2_9PROT|nr:MAG: putative protein containing caspase domain protein [Candidatus Accumulibacter phosphatis]